MQKLNNVTALFALSVALYGCGKESAPLVDFREDSYFDAPEADDVIAPKWIRVSSFRVDGQSDLDAHIEVAVKGKRAGDGSTYCELLTSHKRFRSGRGWTPLPLAFFSPAYESPDGIEDLNQLFQQTLDFSDKQSDHFKITTKVAFNRGKVFTAHWTFYPLLTEENGAPACTAMASVDRNAQTGCHNSRCRLIEAVAEVDKWRHFWAGDKPEREKDDLSALNLSLEDLDAEGYPTGNRYTFGVPEFK